MTVLGARPNRRHGLCRGDVVAGPKVRDVGETENLGEVFGRRSQSEASAHLRLLILESALRIWPGFYHDFTEVPKMFEGSFDTQRTL